MIEHIIYKYLKTILWMVLSMVFAYIPARLISFGNRMRFSHKAYFYVMMISFVLIAVLRRLNII